MAIFIFLMTTACIRTASGAEILLDDFASGLDPGWQEEAFVGKTLYTVVRENGTAMTDTDNTGETATAYYGPIRLHSP